MDETVGEDADALPAPADAGAALALGADGRPATGTTETRAPAPPARLALPVWASRLAESAGGRSVQVALGDDGSVRLQTVRDGDGVTVHLRFSDPDLQALASLHTGRLRDALDAHFAEPVRLSLGDGAAPGDTGGSFPDGSGADGQPNRSSGARSTSAPSRPAPRSSDLAPAAAPSGRREWVG